MIQNHDSCGHFTCKVKLKYQRYANLPTLIAVAAAIMVAVFCFNIWSRIANVSEVKEHALQFAQVLKKAKEDALQSRSIITVKLVPATMHEPAKYSLVRGNDLMDEQALPNAISGSGLVRFDPEGVPFEAADFEFRKGTRTVKLSIDSHGAITFPE